jgi:hypothetical protein
MPGACEGNVVPSSKGLIVAVLTVAISIDQLVGLLK